MEATVIKITFVRDQDNHFIESWGFEERHEASGLLLDSGEGFDTRHEAMVASGLIEEDEF